jgi:hypothetical protein
MDILRTRAQGHRDSTYAMLLQQPMPECLRALEQLVTAPRVGCWRDVHGFIRYYEQHGDPTDAESAVALMAGCVRMTNAQLRKDLQRSAKSWAAKWVPREPKCRPSPLLRWYYDALASDMFPGAPDAQRRYRKLISELTPPPQPEPLGLKHLVKRALNATNATTAAHLNAAFGQLKAKARHHPSTATLPVLSLAHSMGPGHNNCLHAGIGLALLLLPPSGRMLTFSSHAQWHEMQDPHDFVSNAQHLFAAARAPTNGLNANLDSALKLLVIAPDPGLEPGLEPLVISDMEHDDNANNNNNDNSLKSKPLFWNVSHNGRAANFSGDHDLRQINLV